MTKGIPAIDQNKCATCGADAYAEFLRTGKPHICQKEGEIDGKGNQNS